MGFFVGCCVIAGAVLLVGWRIHRTLLAIERQARLCQAYLNQLGENFAAQFPSADNHWPAPQTWAWDVFREMLPW